MYISSQPGDIVSYIKGIFSSLLCVIKYANKTNKKQNNVKFFGDF